MRRNTKNTNNSISCLAIAVVAFMAMTFFAVGPTSAREYTTNDDFDEGVLAGVEHDTVPHQLQLSEEQQTLPFIWVANSGENTVSKINTETGVELGRYLTGPGNENPSRTTVDLNGDLWVGNRNSASAVKIALYPTDVDNDGVIETSTGPSDVKPWGQDEAVLMRVTAPSGTRALAIDASNNVWIGGTGASPYPMNYYDGETGALLGSVTIGRPCYGALIDGNGTLWISNDGHSYLTRVDDPSGTPAVTAIQAPEAWVYGLGIDSAGYIYTSAYTSSRLRKLDPTTNTWVYSYYHSQLGGGRGVCVGTDGDVWVADSHRGTMSRHDSGTGALKATIPVGGTPTGAAVDSKGKIWTTCLSNNTIYRIDPTTNAVDFTQGGHNYPYNYSDMTGYISRTITTKTGTWTVDHDSGSTGTPWGTISWTSDEPAGTSVTVQVRSSDDGSSWSAWEGATNGVALSTTPDGQYIQVEATLQITSGDVSPILYDLTVERAIIDVALDVKPTSCPNPFNVGSNGMLPVAICGTEDFDVTQVDLSTVQLMLVDPVRGDYEDVCTAYLPLVGKAGQYDCTEEGPDGYMDLTLKFDTQVVAEAIELLEGRPLTDGEEIIVTLTGNLLPEYGGTPILGEDVIRIIKKSNGKK